MSIRESTACGACAGVCLLDNPFPIDGVYDYRIPAELAADVRPGVFVTVPFGVANHRRLALVTEVRDHSAYGELKAICSVCPEQMSLDEEMQGLCRFMKTRTLCSTGDAVRAMIPASALSRLVTLYAPDPAYIFTDSDELPSSDLFVYDHLRGQGECSLTALRERFGPGVESRLRRMCQRGILQKRVMLKDASAGRVEKLWAAAVTDREGYALLDGESLEINGQTVKLKNEAQKRLLRALIEAGTPMTAAELKSRADVGDAPLKTLLKNGILATCERRLDRNPYANATYVGQTPMKLNGEQEAAASTLTELAFCGEAKAALLYGVTGSGKTCVMIDLIDRLLAAGKGVILLLPEIALTPQSVSIFCARYGSRVAVIHSALSQGERYDAYCRIRDGGADVVIGTRSAVFSPVRNLGAIIIDEEQEHTYKSDQNPKYHTRDIARYRCAHHKGLMLLASATPSLESYRKAKEGIYTLVTLTQRYGNAKLPRVELADMRQETAGGNLSPLSESLVRRLCDVTAKGEQSVLFLNRRGYNHF